MEIIFLRHGQTQGNVERRFSGSGTDDPLDATGEDQARAAGIHPEVKHVYATPLIRTQQTAHICFPNAALTIVPGLREMHFGDFDGHTADEMKDNPAFQAWVDGNCEGDIPNGESVPVFAQRINEAFTLFVRALDSEGADRPILVAHGGTAMALMKLFADPARNYYEWLPKNCCGYRLTIDKDIWKNEKRFAAYEPFEQLPEHLL